MELTEDRFPITDYRLPMTEDGHQDPIRAESRRTRKMSHYFRPGLVLAVGVATGWFGVYASLVIAGKMKPWETSGPYYGLWYALYGSTRTWACHLLSVLLIAYVLTPFFRFRWVVIPLSVAVGLTVVWGIVILEDGEHIYLGARSYWRENVSQAFDLSLLGEFPDEWFFSALVVWAVPIGIAWMTVRKRSHSRIPNPASRPADEP